MKGVGDLAFFNFVLNMDVHVYFLSLGGARFPLGVSNRFPILYEFRF